jgi:hypothetical protein
MATPCQRLAAEVILPPAWLILLRLDRSCRAQLGAVVHWGEKCALCGSWKSTARKIEGAPLHLDGSSADQPD